MTAKKGKFYFQKREDSAASHHCCVPKCTASAKCNSVLSFHAFPKDGELRKKWMINIRRDKFSATDATRVCSRHFTTADVIQPSTPGGRRLLKKGAVPVLFQWNNYSVPAPRPSVWDRTERPYPPCAAAPDETDQPMDLDYLDHDYCSRSENKENYKHGAPSMEYGSPDFVPSVFSQSSNQKKSKVKLSVRRMDSEAQESNNVSGADIIVKAEDQSSEEVRSDDVRSDDVRSDEASSSCSVTPMNSNKCDAEQKMENCTESESSKCHQTVQTDLEKPQDCDEYYFMSLVKMFKKLPPHRKAEVRMKIERLLFEAEFQ